MKTLIGCIYPFGTNDQTPLFQEEENYYYEINNANHHKKSVLDLPNGQEILNNIKQNQLKKNYKLQEVGKIYFNLFP